MIAPAMMIDAEGASRICHTFVRERFDRHKQSSSRANMLRIGCIMIAEHGS